MAVLQIFNALVAFTPFNNSLSYRDSTSLISIKMTTKRKSQPVSLVGSFTSPPHRIRRLQEVNKSEDITGLGF